jgi:two-component system sensor histidine kinase KdpD
MPVRVPRAVTAPAAAAAPDAPAGNPGGRRVDWPGYAWAVGATAAATAAGWLLYHGPRPPDASRHPVLADSSVLMLYLLAVLWVATRHSRGAAVLASVLGVATFDFCFVPPYLTFVVANQQYLITFAAMLITALVISGLTHRVRAQATAARRAWEWAEAEFLRNTLLSAVSHDLRTPLAGITGAASTLIEAGDALPPEARAEMLATIYSESERMDRLVANLLDMTRLESGGLVLKKEWQPLAEVVGSALRHLDRRLRGRRVEIDLPGDLPLAEFDAVAVEQVLVNLLDNAAAHTPPGTPVSIRARGADGHVEVEVADEGPGLPPGTEGRVFEKFFRAGDEGRHGTGLGLAICRGIVEAHGGTITAGNRPGGGAAFRFTLPRGGTPPTIDSTG